MTSPLFPDDETPDFGFGSYPAYRPEPPKEVSRQALQAKEDGKRIWAEVQAYIRRTNAR